MCVCVCVLGVGVGVGVGEGSVAIATRFSIPRLDNPFSCYYQPNNYLTNSYLLTLITLSYAIKHISRRLMKSE